MPIAVNRRGMALLECSRVPEDELDSGTYNPLPGTIIVVTHSQDFLLAYHSARQGWELPGGRIEEGESPRSGERAQSNR